MMKPRRRELPNAAKIAIVAMLVADGAGLYFANSKINHTPALSTDEASEDFVMAKPLPAAPTAPSLVRQAAPIAMAAAAPLERPVEAYPAALDLKPIAMEQTSTQIERAAEARLTERALTIPAVRFAQLSPEKRQSHSFASAFGRDLQAPAVGFAPDLSLAKLPAEEEPVLPGAAYNGGQNDAMPAATDPVAAAVIEAPAAEAAATPQAPITAPTPSASPEGELPPS